MRVARRVERSSVFILVGAAGVWRFGLVWFGCECNLIIRRKGRRRLCESGYFHLPVHLPTCLVPFIHSVEANIPLYGGYDHEISVLRKGVARCDRRCMLA